MAGFFSRMRGANPLAEAAKLLKPEAGIDHEARLAEAEAVTADEQRWLDGRVNADGARDPYEDALLAFVEAEKSS